MTCELDHHRGKTDNNSTYDNFGENHLHRIPSRKYLKEVLEFCYVNPV